MCLLLLYVVANPLDKDDYLVVLASNRDEFLDRPSSCCHFWEKNPNIIGGMDLEEGKEGGTWLAMNTEGKISHILNIIKPLTSTTAISKRSRGFLVVDYLKSRLDGPTFLYNLQEESNVYDDFTMITVDIRPTLDKVRACYYTNSGKHTPAILPSGCHVFGNCVPSRPWEKLGAAKKKFVEVLHRNDKITSKDLLIEDLFEMLKDDTQYGPDEQLINDAEGRTEETLRQLSSIFVKDIDSWYGTRTHTVIIVDRGGNVDYIEKTMQEPITISREPSWITTRMYFTIKDQYTINSHL
ncbi:transport and Golgi organization 2 homolog [Centruroides vittatus]|uniref:transport and Golgi organization 2 homolog n=1 Tax=Centruroides vittatus TaxID=120091 RepID=UPI00350F2E54